MRSFLSIPDEPKVEPATECGSCSSGVKVGGEDITTVTKVDKGNDDVTTSDSDIKSAETIVMTGPLGSAVTEALNKTLAKKTAGIGNESMPQVQANGQIYQPQEYIASLTRSVGMVPRTGDEPTTINMMLDAAAKVDTVDFFIVEDETPAIGSDRLNRKSLLFSTQDLRPGTEGYAVESVDVVVRVRKVLGK